jgi:integrase
VSELCGATQNNTVQFGAAPRARARTGEENSAVYDRAQCADDAPWFHNMIALAGEAAKFPFPVHPHMLRHATGYKLANDGHETRPYSTTLATEHLHTVRYIELSPERFKHF